MSFACSVIHKIGLIFKCFNISHHNSKCKASLLAIGRRMLNILLATSDWNWGRHGHDRMVVGFTTTFAISAYHLDARFKFYWLLIEAAQYLRYHQSNNVYDCRYILHFLFIYWYRNVLLLGNFKQIMISNKPCQCRNKDYWADYTPETNSPPAEVSTQWL